jgi:transposase
MSRKGNRFARRILWMLAVGAVRRVPEYHSYYQQRVAEGKSRMKTLIAVGRKLLCAIFAILRTGVPYDPNRYLQRCPAH